MPDLEIKRVRKAYGKVDVLKDVDLTLRAGEFTVLVGPSGCGKSTLLRSMAGLEQIDGGSIQLGDRRIDTLEPAERGVAMVFQNYALYPHMTVSDNISFGLRLKRTPRPVIDAKLQDVAKILQIMQLLARKPRALSGGQRQRVAIGRAIIRQPEIFLFDEPLSNLDAKLRVQMRLELTKLHRQLGATMVYVTHDQVEAMTMADTIVVMNGGQVEQIGAPLDLYHRPANMFVAGFLGSPAMNFCAASIAGRAAGMTTVKLESGLLLDLPFGSATAIGDRVTLGIRPEHLRIAKAGQGGVAAGVDVVERLGSETFVYATAASGESYALQAPGDANVDFGDSIAILFDAAVCHLFGADGVALKPAAR